MRTTSTSDRPAARVGRNRHVLLCNGAPAPRRAGRPGAAATAWELRTFGPAANVRLRVDDITRALGRQLPDEVLDLLELAALVYAADQCCGRTPGRRFEYGLTFHRDLRFHVAVRRPGFWSRPDVLDALTEALHFLSYDDYVFDFSLLRDPPPVEAYLFGDAGPAPGPVEEVMLMSGGLDSLAGAVEQVLHRGRRVAMVSHRPADHVTARQRRLVAAVGRRGKGLVRPPVHVPVTCHKLGLEEHDATQRTRSFLYATLGAAVAHLFGLSEVWFYENGVTSVNLPLCGQEVGGRATRTTHPRAMHGFSQVLSLAFGRPMAARNGFFWHTKQDVLEVLRPGRNTPLAADSVSCSHTRWTTSPSPHCGLCSQCLARRVAALGAAFGPHDPGDGYRIDPLTGDRQRDEERILAERFLGQARSVARMTAVREFDRAYAGELARVYPYLDMPTPTAAARLFDLHLRHARQVSEAVLGEARAHLADGWNGTLGPTSALTYAYGLVGPGVPKRSRAAVPVAAADEGDGDNAARGRGGDDGSGLRVDAETFTATHGGQQMRFGPRATQSFLLLARVGRRPGHRVAFDDLRGPGGVWTETDPSDVTIRGAIHRLRGLLRDGGLEAVPDALSTTSVGPKQFVVLDLAG